MIKLQNDNFLKLIFSTLFICALAFISSCSDSNYETEIEERRQKNIIESKMYNDSIKPEIDKQFEFIEKRIPKTWIKVAPYKGYGERSFMGMLLYNITLADFSPEIEEKANLKLNTKLEITIISRNPEYIFDLPNKTLYSETPWANNATIIKNEFPQKPIPEGSIFIVNNSGYNWAINDVTEKTSATCDDSKVKECKDGFIELNIFYPKIIHSSNGKILLKRFDTSLDSPQGYNGNNNAIICWTFSASAKGSDHGFRCSGKINEFEIGLDFPYEATQYSADLMEKLLQELSFLETYK